MDGEPVQGQRDHGRDLPLREARCSRQGRDDLPRVLPGDVTVQPGQRLRDQYLGHRVRGAPDRVGEQHPGAPGLCVLHRAQPRTDEPVPGVRAGVLPGLSRQQTQQRPAALLGVTGEQLAEGGRVRGQPPPEGAADLLLVGRFQVGRPAAQVADGPAEGACVQQEGGEELPGGQAVQFEAVGEEGPLK